MSSRKLPTNIDADIAPCVDPATVGAVALVEETREVLIRMEALEDGGGGRTGDGLSGGGCLGGYLS